MVGRSGEKAKQDQHSSTSMDRSLVDRLSLLSPGDEAQPGEEIHS